MGLLDLLFGKPQRTTRKVDNHGRLRCPRCGNTTFFYNELNAGEDGDSDDEFSDVCKRCKFRIQHDIYGRPLRYRKGKRRIIKRIIYKKQVRYFRKRKYRR